MIHFKDTECRPGFIKVLIHDSYGLGGIPDWLEEEYEKRTGKELPNHRDYDRRMLRYDPICIDIMKELHETKRIMFQSEYVKEDGWKVVVIPETLKNYFSVTEYDGRETLRIETTSLLLHLLQSKNDDTSKEILKQFRDMLQPEAS